MKQTVALFLGDGTYIIPSYHLKEGQLFTLQLDADGIDGLVEYTSGVVVGEFVRVVELLPLTNDEVTESTDRWKDFVKKLVKSRNKKVSEAIQSDAEKLSNLARVMYTGTKFVPTIKIEAITALREIADRIENDYLHLK